MDYAEIARLRRKQGLRQEDVASKIGVHVLTVSRWERGITEPNLSELKKLCEVLDVSLEDLLNGPRSKEWRIEVVFRREEDWEMHTVDMSASAPNLFLVQVGMEKIGLNLVGEVAATASLIVGNRPSNSSSG